MRLLDPQTFQFTDKANYLNHPPKFYALLGACSARRSKAIRRRCSSHRLIDVAIAAARICRAALARPRGALPASGILRLRGAARLHSSAGADRRRGEQRQSRLLRRRRRQRSALWQAVVTDRDGWLALALAGVVAASWAKLTGLLLTVPMVERRHGLSALARTIAVAVDRSRRLAVLALAATPYLEFILSYGSPTPETPAQLALIADGAHAAGWADLPRKSFADYLAYFVGAFVADWMPTLGARSAFNYAMLVIPAAALVCAACRYRAVAAPHLAAAGNRARRRRHRRIMRDRARPSRSMSISATAAISRPDG